MTAIDKAAQALKSSHDEFVSRFDSWWGNLTQAQRDAYDADALSKNSGGIGGDLGPPGLLPPRQCSRCGGILFDASGLNLACAACGATVE